MNSNKIAQIIQSGLGGAVVHVAGEGCNCQVQVITDEFDGLSSVKRQQRVYGLIQDLITSGEMHAVSLQTYTPQEWEQVNG